MTKCRSWIDILDTYAVLDLREGIPKHTLDNLKALKVAGRKFNISHAGGELINSEMTAAPASKKKDPPRK